MKIKFDLTVDIDIDDYRRWTGQDDLTASEVHKKLSSRMGQDIADVIRNVEDEARGDFINDIQFRSPTNAEIAAGR